MGLLTFCVSVLDSSTRYRTHLHFQSQVMAKVPFREERGESFQNLESKIINTSNRLSICGSSPRSTEFPISINKHLQEHYSSFGKSKVLGREVLISSQSLFGAVCGGSVKLHAISRQRRAPSREYFLVR